MVRRTDYRRLGSWLPEDCAPVPESQKEVIYQKWKSEDPAAAQRAWDEVQAYKVARDARKFQKAGGPVTAAMPQDFDKVVVHFTMEGQSFVSDLRTPQCDVRVISEISTRKGFKLAYHALGRVSRSTFFWLSLLHFGAEANSGILFDDMFWKNLDWR